MKTLGVDSADEAAEALLALQSALQLRGRLSHTGYFMVHRRERPQPVLPPSQNLARSTRVSEVITSENVWAQDKFREPADCTLFISKLGI